MSPALAPGFNYLPWCRLHILQNRVANNQGRFLSGCVTEWGKAVSNMKRSVVNHGPLFWATFPSNRHPTTLTTRLLGGCWGTAYSG